MQNSSAQCGRREQQLWVEVGLHPGSALCPYLFQLLVDMLTEDVRNDLPGSMKFVDDIVLSGDNETDMAEYLEERIIGQRGEDQDTLNLDRI